MRIGILGIQARSTTPWCVLVSGTLRDLDPSVEVWTPDDDAWADINWSSGDAVQPIINGITNRQVDGIASCDTLVVYLGCDEVGLGARLELGRILMTDGLRIHVVLHPDLAGRHYIRSYYQLARASVTEHPSLVGAAIAAFLDASVKPL